MVERICNIWNIKKRAVSGNPDASPPVPAVAAMQTTGETFQINNAKLYVAVVT